MANAREQMKTIEAELKRVQGEIEKLQIQEELLLRLQAQMSGDPIPEPATRRRAVSIKPMILEIMTAAGSNGKTSVDVSRIVKEREPNVAAKTVGSVLSRLKSDGALVYIGERYYEKHAAPQPAALNGDYLRAIN